MSVLNGVALGIGWMVIGSFCLLALAFLVAIVVGLFSQDVELFPKASSTRGGRHLRVVGRGREISGGLETSFHPAPGTGPRPTTPTGGAA